MAEPAGFTDAQTPFQIPHTDLESGIGPMDFVF